MENTSAIWRLWGVPMDNGQTYSIFRGEFGYNGNIMKTIPSLFKRGEATEARPFNLIITILLLVTSALTVFTGEALLRWPLLFGGLLALHLLLHWQSGLATTSLFRSVIYLGVQGGLAFLLVMVSQSPALALALYATMIAETVGLFGLTRLTVVAVIGYLTLTAFSYYALGGVALMSAWASPTVSTMVLLFLFMVLYRRQADERQRSQALLAELESAHSQLAGYAAQVESLTLAAERQRLARELHDTLAQGVAGLVLQLEAANAHLEQDHVARAQAIIQQSMKRARNTLAEARAAIDDLRLENSSLAEAVQRHVDRFSQATGIPCHLTLDLSAEARIPPVVADHAERVVGESLANVARHAQASNVWLTVRQTEDALLVDARDDGIGFDMERVVDRGHYGLLGIRERTRAVNGRFEITSAPQAGTDLHVILPLSDAQVHRQT